MDSVTGHEIATILWRAVNEPGSDPLEPANLEIFETTLSPRSCKAFFRMYPDLAAENRDYYLSKIFQFLGGAIDAAGLDAVLETLESALDQIPPDLLATAHKRFDVWGLAHALAGDGRALDVRSILTACNLRRKRPMTPGRAGRTQANPHLARKRREPWRQYKGAGGTTKLLCYALGGMDRSQVSLWKTGKLPDTSEVRKRIEEEIRRLLVVADEPATTM